MRADTEGAIDPSPAAGRADIRAALPMALDPDRAWRERESGPFDTSGGRREVLGMSQQAEVLAESVDEPAPPGIVRNRHLPTAGWVFVALGCAVVGLRLQMIVESGRLDPAGYAQAIAYGCSAVAVTLMPAALLYRVPGAWRSHRLLLVGLVVGGLQPVAMATWPLLLSGVQVPDEVTQFVFWGGLNLLGALGALLVALGLWRLRARRARRRVACLLAALVVLELCVPAVTYVPLVTRADPPPAEALPGILLSTAILILRVPIAAFATWVPVAAWIERDAPSRFWTMLAVAAVAALAELVLTSALALAMTAARDLALAIDTLAFAFTAAASVLVLVAYARFVPGPPSPRADAPLEAEPDPPVDAVATRHLSSVRVGRHRPPAQ